MKLVPYPSEDGEYVTIADSLEKTVALARQHLRWLDPSVAVKLYWLPLGPNSDRHKLVDDLQFRIFYHCAMRNAAERVLFAYQCTVPTTPSAAAAASADAKHPPAKRVSPLKDWPRPRVVTTSSAPLRLRLRLRKHQITQIAQNAAAGTVESSAHSGQRYLCGDA